MYLKLVVAWLASINHANLTSFGGENLNRFMPCSSLLRSLQCFRMTSLIQKTDGKCTNDGKKWTWRKFLMVSYNQTIYPPFEKIYGVISEGTFFFPKDVPWNLELQYLAFRVKRYQPKDANDERWVSWICLMLSLFTFYHGTFVFSHRFIQQNLQTDLLFVPCFSKHIKPIWLKIASWSTPRSSR